MALPSDVDYSDKNVRVFTRGLRTTCKALEDAGAQAQEMTDVFRGIGRVVERNVRINHRTGRLEATKRLAVYKNKASIKLGRAAVPYAARYEYGVNLTVQGTKTYGTEKINGKRVKVQYGESHTKIPGHFALASAIRRSRSRTYKMMVEGLERLCRKYDVPMQVKITGYVITRIGKNGRENAAYSTDSKYLS